jgi:hypothetical protein
VTRTPRVGDDLGHLVNLSLGTAEGTEPLLRKTTGTLVLGVAEEFDDTLLVGSKTGDLTSDLADELGALGQETLPPRDPGGRSPGGDLCYSR